MTSPATSHASVTVRRLAGRVRGGSLFDARHLFTALLVLVRPRTVCDVGSCDGTEAFRFRRLLPGARVIAFEANDANHASIAADPRSASIELRREAVSDLDGETTFYVLDAPGDKPWARGSSSLNRRGEEIRLGLEERAVRVPACRLDTVLGEADGPIALWIDVEGAAARVVEGLAGIAGRVGFVLIELEPEPLWEGTAPATAVIARLSELGFRRIGRTPDGPLQDNVLFARRLRPWHLWPARGLALGRELIDLLAGGRQCGA